MGPIFHLTLLDNLRSLRFQLSLLVVAAFFVGNGFVYAWKGDRAVVEEQQILAATSTTYASIESVADAVGKSYRVISLPTGTEFIAEAGSDWFPYAYNVRPRTHGWSYFGSSRGTNSWLRRFEIVDWGFIVRYVVSFLCIALAYDAISGERERGTLRLLLANPLPRAHVLLGKVAAHLTCLTAALATGALLSLLIMGLTGSVALGFDIAALVLLFLVVSAVYAAVFLLLACGVSAATGRSATSLVILVLLWALLVVVIPQSSRLVVLTTMDRFDGWNRIGQLRSETEAVLEREGLAMRPAERARADGFDLEQRYARIQRELEDDIEAIQRQSLRHQLDEYRRARLVNALSPGFAFTYAVESLTGNGIQRFEHFAPQARAYLRSLRDFLRDRDAADSASPHIHFFPAYMSRAALEPGQVPRFAEDRLSAVVSATHSPWALLILAAEALAALWFALWALHRAPVAEAADD